MTTKRRKRHNPEQIVRKLRDADAMLNAGKDLAAVRLKNLEEEKKRLKELVAEKELVIKASHRGGKLVSPARKREAVTKLRDELGMSERRACRVLSQPRSTHRRRPSPRGAEAALVKRML